MKHGGAGGGNQSTGTPSCVSAVTGSSGLVGWIQRQKEQMFVIEAPADAVVAVGSVIAGRGHSLFPEVVGITERFHALHEQHDVDCLLTVAAHTVSGCHGAVVVCGCIAMCPCPSQTAPRLTSTAKEGNDKQVLCAMARLERARWRRRIGCSGQRRGRGRGGTAVW